MARRKLRVDELLVERGLFETRAAAERACLAGCVMSGTERMTSPGRPVLGDIPLVVKGAKGFVSRGGFKLEGALLAFGFDPRGLRCIDLGASTGGFTDCLLQAGAAEVCAVDVGYGQLAWSLRNDERVDVFERVNVRTADPTLFGAPFDLAVADLSFISLTVLASAVRALICDQGTFIALVKPQFESERGSVDAQGVVLDQGVHAAVLDKVVTCLNDESMGVQALAFSPLKGPEGNIEFLVLARKGALPQAVSIESVVSAAHEALDAPLR
jgi:23S rRNA (cytidine1920-2'-O)/16S rRNA (cytidine1409-2'-O)-methyltransferase